MAFSCMFLLQFNDENPSHGDYDHSVFDTTAQLTERCSARHKPKQPPAKKSDWTPLFEYRTRLLLLINLFLFPLVHAQTCSTCAIFAFLAICVHPSPTPPSFFP